MDRAGGRDVGRWLFALILWPARGYPGPPCHRAADSTRSHSAAMKSAGRDLTISAILDLSCAPESSATGCQCGWLSLSPSSSPGSSRSSQREQHSHRRPHLRMGPRDDSSLSANTNSYEHPGCVNRKDRKEASTRKPHRTEGRGVASATAQMRDWQLVAGTTRW